MNANRVRVVVAVFAVLGLILINSCCDMTQNKTLRVGYPLFALRQDQRILDPDNTELIYHYYLLENLALGLVRDSSQSPSGYAPGLAQSWEHPSPMRWIFHLHPDLAWSDGNPIEPLVIAAHIERLAKNKHRHIVYLKGLKSATVRNREIVLDFHSPTNEGLIHELGLADAALLHPDNLTKGWGITSGPFTVEAYEPGRRLVLRKNKRHREPIDYPDSVELVPFTMDTIGEFFDSVDIDLLKVPVPSFRGANPKILANAPQILRGYPTWIYYFYFNTKKPMWLDGRARREFMSEVDLALKGFSYADLKRETQLIPEGYSGRLGGPMVPEEASSTLLKDRRLRINMLPSFSDGAPIREALLSGFARAGVSLEIGYASGPKNSKDEADVQMSQFTGNQHDAMGSWQFMFSASHGDLAHFRPEVEGVFRQIMAADTDERREAGLRTMHSQVLKEAYAVPLFIEPGIIAASKRVDLSRLNPFDMRLRFYEVQWK